MVENYEPNERLINAGSLLNYINNSDDAALDHADQQNVKTRRESEPFTNNLDFVQTFNPDAFHEFVRENYYTKINFLPFVKKFFVHKNRNEILNAYLLKNGFQRLGDYDVYYLNSESEEIVFFSFFIVDGYLLPESNQVVFDFLKAVNFEFHDHTRTKRSLSYLTKNKKRAGDTTFLDVFRVGKSKIVYYGNSDHTTTLSTKLSHDPFVQNVADGDGVLVINVETYAKIENSCESQSPVLARLYRNISDNLKSLGIKNELVIVKIARASDYPCPVYYFDGENLQSAFESPQYS